MRKFGRVLVMVTAGIIGGYFGYWIGHLAGWTTGAEWPWQIGGGTGAILLSIGMAVVGVLTAAMILALPSVYTARRLQRSGLLADSTIIDIWDLGLTSRVGGYRRQIEFTVELRDGDKAHRAKGVQWLSQAEIDTLVPGDHVTVRYESEHPNRVVLQLGEVEREPIPVT